MEKKNFMKERNNLKVIGTLDYFEEYSSKCEYELGKNENGRKINKFYNENGDNS